MKPVLVAVLLLAAPALAAPKKDQPSAEQKEADKHFKSGVALYKEAKFNEALAEFERAYEIAPHPLVLNNIAACHREMSNYGLAVKYYRRFLEEGKGKVPAARIAEAQKDLDAILNRIARITVVVTGGEGAKVILDGNELGTMPLDGPLMVPPGEHKLVVRAPNYKDGERVVRVASGDQVEVKLQLVEAPVEQSSSGGGVAGQTDIGATHTPEKPRRFSISAGFGTNLLIVPDAGAPSLGVGFQVHSRVQVGLEATLIAYSVIPNARFRIIGEQLSLHAAVAVPVAFNDGEMSEVFVAGAVGLGVRYRAMPLLAFRLEAFAAYASNNHGFTLPAFFGGELWF